MWRTSAYCDYKPLSTYESQKANFVSKHSVVSEPSCSRMFVTQAVFCLFLFGYCLFLFGYIFSKVFIFSSLNSGGLPTGENHSLAVPWRSSPRSVLRLIETVSFQTGDAEQTTVGALCTDHVLVCVFVSVCEPGGPPRPGMLPTPPMGAPPMMPMMGPPPHGMMPGGPGEATRCISHKNK